jgi:hypothetical protein
MKKYWILLAIILSESFSLFGQDDFYNYYRPILSYEAGSLESVSAGFSLMKLTRESEYKLKSKFHGPTFDAGVAFNEDDLLMKSRIAYEYFGYFAGARLNVLHYSDFKQQSIAVKPELCFTLYHFITIGYGYSIPMSSDHFQVKGNFFNIGIGLYFPRK